MPAAFKLDAAALDALSADDAVVFVHDDLAPAAAAVALLGEGLAAQIARAALLDRFKGKLKSTMTLFAPEGAAVGRIIVVGLGPVAEASKIEAVALGGHVGGLARNGRRLAVIAASASGALTDEHAADIALGLRLRAYKFETYKTVRKDDAEEPAPLAVTLHVEKPAGLRKILKDRDAVAGGVELARDLVNEPPNVLNPVEFAKRAQALEKLGVEVEVLGEKELRKIGMRALLGVGQGSENESRVVIMRWNGGKSGEQPIAFIGKGVTFDTGGISIKPAQGMEDMKGDMAGAACVVGLMHTLAARKVKANVIGAIGLVENMPDGAAQRPGDIVTSLSGQTIEIINTDAEGRLVLADVLWHVKEQFKPRYMINLATLTGAILIALGKENAGLFSNDDDLAAKLAAAGTATGETVWRMPMGPAYDKMIDSKFADMKNTGGRHAGSITAAQFLKRFVGETPWAHLDIAGTGMDSSPTDYSRSWASGWGVRLLDRLVRDDG